MTARTSRADLPLTERQRELLHLLALGLTYEEAADRLEVGRNTVKTHVYKLYRRLGARNRKEAVRLGRERGELGEGIEPPPRVAASGATAREDRTVSRGVPRDGVRHGTPSGWYRHQYRRERPCDACFRARQAYDQRRLAAPERVLMNRLHARAQHAALSRLRQLHLDEWEVLYREEKERLLAERAADEAADDVTGSVTLTTRLDPATAAPDHPIAHSRRGGRPVGT